jgi:L-amino acid N-acyltransferase YncA
VHEVGLRTVGEGDVPSIAAIYAEAVRTGTASFEIDPPDEGEMVRRLRLITEGGFPCFVAVSNDRLVGYAYAGRYHTRPGYRFTVEDSIYVAAPARGLGIGGRLLSALIEGCEARGLRQMVAVIGDSANHASIRLHEGRGFRLTGTLKAVGWKHGRGLDSVIMQRALGEGCTSVPS